MKFCSDASAVVAWLLTSQRSALVEAFWTSITRADEILGPQMLFPECSSTLREKVHRGLLTHNDAMELTAQMLELPIRISSVQAQFLRAMELANQTKRIKSYDMQYVALAEAEGCEIVTLDGGVYQAAVEIGVRARLLR